MKRKSTNESDQKSKRRKSGLILNRIFAANPLLPRESQLKNIGASGFTGLFFSFILVDLKDFPVEFLDMVLAKTSAERGTTPHPLGRGSTRGELWPAVHEAIELCPFAESKHPPGDCFCLELQSVANHAPCWTPANVQKSLLQNHWYDAIWDKQHYRFSSNLNPLSNMIIGGLHAPSGYTNLLTPTVSGNPILVRLCETLDGLLEADAPIYFPIKAETITNLRTTLGLSSAELEQARQYVDALRKWFGRCLGLEQFSCLLERLGAEGGDSVSRALLLDIAEAKKACSDQLRKDLFESDRPAVQMTPDKIAGEHQHLKETILLLHPQCGNSGMTLTELVLSASGKARTINCDQQAAAAAIAPSASAAPSAGTLLLAPLSATSASGFLLLPTPASANALSLTGESGAPSSSSSSAIRAPLAASSRVVGTSSSSNSLTFSHARTAEVTVFGYSKDKAAAIVSYFQQFGSIVQTTSGGSNWMHLRYSSLAAAETAIAQNGKVVHDDMIGVCYKESSAAPQKQPTPSFRRIGAPMPPVAPPRLAAKPASAPTAESKDSQESMSGQSSSSSSSSSGASSSADGLRSTRSRVGWICPVCDSVAVAIYCDECGTSKPHRAQPVPLD